MNEACFCGLYNLHSSFALEWCWLYIRCVFCRLSQKGLLELNCQIPGLPIMYCFNLERDQDWKTYFKPLDVSGSEMIYLRTWWVEVKCVRIWWAKVILKRLVLSVFWIIYSFFLKSFLKNIIFLPNIFVNMITSAHIGLWIFKQCFLFHSSNDGKRVSRTIKMKLGNKESDSKWLLDNQERWP